MKIGSGQDCNERKMYMIYYTWHAGCQYRNHRAYKDFFRHFRIVLVWKWAFKSPEPVVPSRSECLPVPLKSRKIFQP